MPARTALRRRPRSLVGVFLTVACLVVVGWAVRGLLQDPVPPAPEFGSAAGSVEQPDPSPVGDDGSAEQPGRQDTAASSSAQPSAAAPSGSLAQPGRSPATLPRAEERSEPVRLMLPAVGLEVAVDAVGVAPDGQMEIPEDPDRAGWYRHGPAPGDDAGSVVVAAHVDSSAGPGAFLALTRVQEGDEVMVELADGTQQTFRVIGGEQVAKTDLAVDELFRREGDPVLRLVTCTGDWSPRLGHYTDNLVISAVPVA
ncbi:MAG TPA: class F sortase [Ornithinicoccus sp.]|nr:class F sortase [Ornithinicoccus sp.]